MGIKTVKEKDLTTIFKTIVILAGHCCCIIKCVDVYLSSFSDFTGGRITPSPTITTTTLHAPSDRSLKGTDLGVPPLECTGVFLS